MENARLKLNDYLSKYGKLYDKRALKFIKDSFLELTDPADAPDILLQVYSELGIYSAADNLYLSHLNNIKRHFSIGGNILEVGGGMFPAFARLLSKEQIKLNSGKLTVYDPNLIIQKLSNQNIKLVKKEFDGATNINDFDLIVGIYPCEATESIIINACKNKKDFYLAMCGCVHFDFMKAMIFGTDPVAYQNYIINLAKQMLEENNNGTLEFDTIDDKFGRSEYPILYNKKRS